MIRGDITSRWYLSAFTNVRVGIIQRERERIIRQEIEKNETRFIRINKSFL